MVKQQAPAVRPAKKPQTSSSRGQFMDFRPRRKPTARPTAKSTTKPATAPLRKNLVPKTAPTLESVRPARKRAAKPAPVPDEPLETVADFLAEDEPEEVYVEELSMTFGAAPADLPKDPFLKSVDVDKRPLSSFRSDDYDSSAPTVIREEDFHGELKNTYLTRRGQKDLSEDPRADLDREKKPVSPSFIIAVILTILLGAGVGAFIYLAFFQ